MNPKILLRIASVTMFLHLIGHSFGNASWKKTNDPLKIKVIGVMTDYKFPFMGSIRSFGENFTGYGYAVSLLLILLSLLLWIISSSLNLPSNFISKILVTIFICLLGLSVDEFVFFFPFAAGMSLFSAFLTGIAVLQIYKREN
jgi:hypothetical protein